MVKFSSMKYLTRISQEYFNYMGRSYPVMCLSDEFYFLPRAKSATRFLNFLDSLDEQKVKQDITCIKNLKRFLRTVNLRDIDFEAQIDLALLNQSMSTFLIEFEDVKIWQLDPTLYLKIILLGVDQILTRFSFIKADIEENLRARIAQIPRLLSEAKNNLKKIPLAYLEIAIEMVDSSIDYFKTSILHLKDKYPHMKDINSLVKKILSSLEDFKQFLITRPLCKGFNKDEAILRKILKDSFSYKKSLPEIFEIATEEYRWTLKEMAAIAKIIKANHSWQQILSAYRIKATSSKALLHLYASQIKKIKNFLEKKKVITTPSKQNILVKFTPDFMKPLRASASYSSPITNDRREPAYFYIPMDFSKLRRRGKKTFSDNIHNEYVFVTAHETFPGHHLLDSVRRSLKNPIRQQIETPLFYEGWSSYAERLVIQLGYTKDPLQILVSLKRQAWRAIRAMIDVGVRINKLKPSRAQELLKGLGYEPERVKSMLRCYLLMPGYQLCYTIGKFEIDRLKKNFSSQLGLKRFYDYILQSGQIPFNLLEKRLRKKLCQKSS